MLLCGVISASCCIQPQSGYVTRCKKAIIQSDIQSHTRYGDAAISKPTVCVRIQFTVIWCTRVIAADSTAATLR